MNYVSSKVWKIKAKFLKTKQKKEIYMQILWHSTETSNKQWSYGQWSFFFFFFFFITFWILFFFFFFAKDVLEFDVYYSLYKFWYKSKLHQPVPKDRFPFSEFKLCGWCSLLANVCFNLHLRQTKCSDYLTNSFFLITRSSHLSVLGKIVI